MAIFSLLGGFMMTAVIGIKLFAILLQDELLHSNLEAQGMVGIQKIGFERLLTLENLELRYLSFNNFNNNILSSFTSFTSLKSLYLNGNKLNRKLNIEGFPVLRNLQYLYLDSSTLNNSFLQSIGTLTSFKILLLCDCGLSGTIPSTKDNMFQIPISLHPFVNLSKLTYFESGGNKIYVETEMENMIPKFQLKTLYLFGDGYGGAFPKFLYHQYELEQVALSNIKFRERFPYWLLDNNTNLESFYLANNSFSEPLQLPIRSYVNLSELDISDNSFYGHIPIQIGAYFPSLTKLKMSRSGIHCSIPNSIGNMSSLTYMDLSNNQLSGNIPNSIENMPSLYVLTLTDNDISGNLSHNHMNGSIPSWIGGLPQLGYLILSNNNFEGEIPIQLCKLNYLSVVDLSHNKLTSPIHPCLKCSSNPERTFYIGVNSISAFMEGNLELTMKSLSLSYEGMIATYISGIDFSCNNFTGNIPFQFGKLSEIKLLNLSHNSLIGPIPTTFFNLSQIESLDLSNNKL
ncbi:receptor-like protein 15 [Ricinus communis]|uniref:receptor-like protein 15 n=1 Tax=Ricinus communis TaxID=3988 RepID=UPI00201A9893|nr:receptor-like protein 15 [Ricinus communis]